MSKDRSLPKGTELCLECLRLAFARAGAADARPWRTIAEDFHAWVTEEGNASQPASGNAPEKSPRRR